MHAGSLNADEYEDTRLADAFEKHVRDRKFPMRRGKVGFSTRHIEDGDMP